MHRARIKRNPLYLVSKKVAIFALMIGLSPSVWAADEVLFEAKYKGKIEGFKIKGKRQLVKKDDDSFVLKAHAENAFASILEDSHFKTQNYLLIPQRYEYERKILGFSSIQTLSFDWSENKVEYIRKDKPKKNKILDISPSVLDPSLYQLAMQADAYNGEKNLRYVYVKSHRVKSMDFEFMGTENYEMKDTSYVGLKFKRKDTKDEKKTEILLVPELAFQIAQITHTGKDGKISTLSLKEFKYDEEKLPSFYKSLNSNFNLTTSNSNAES